MEIIAPKIERKRRPASEWKSLIADWHVSGLSQKAFCEQNGLAISTFCNWLNKLSESVARDDDAFIELTPLSLSGEADLESPWLVELDLGSGIVLRIAREA